MGNGKPLRNFRRTKILAGEMLLLAVCNENLENEAFSIGEKAELPSSCQKT